MYELKSEELKETDWNKYDISKALTLELNIVGNEGATHSLKASQMHKTAMCASFLKR